jgi:hypothetical protein
MKIKEITIKGIYIYRALLLPIFLIIYFIYALDSYQSTCLNKLYDWIDDI